MKHIEETWPEKLNDEVQILWLSITMDGFNMYSLQNTNYLVWPVAVINNNIHSWFSMKNEHLLLYLIVLGRRQVKRMYVYLQLVIDEFKRLWEGIQVYDVSIPIPMKRYFTLYGICVYRMQDYPRLGVFSSKHVDWFVYNYNSIWNICLIWSNHILWC